ncbi:hypothetical protein [Calycomorphotria hydatis]|uniref:PilZ domain-containing protein n=1 Tax=Calycomorphotria hydatis TaxID=2528027 RepID=A0A517T4V6_9PLAN|nr:hypothetical protein [Calycomorphotria hydatis]QDT63416.1 hypothetical protein V22_06370 [Calycomorphotria hydatis]
MPATATKTTACSLAALEQVWQERQLPRVSWVKPGLSRVNRQSHRVPFHVELVVTPYDLKQREICGEPMIANGCDISLRGISFTHVEQIVSSYALVEMTDVTAAEKRIGPLFVKLRWCHFIGPNRYQSGGLILHAYDED